MDSSRIIESLISRFESCLENSFFPKKRKFFSGNFFLVFRIWEAGLYLKERFEKMHQTESSPATLLRLSLASPKSMKVFSR